VTRGTMARTRWRFTQDCVRSWQRETYRITSMKPWSGGRLNSIATFVTLPQHPGKMTLAAGSNEIHAFVRATFREVTPDETAGSTGQLLRQDIDGCSFINIFAPPLSRWSSLSTPNATGDMKEFLMPIRSFLKGRLTRARGDLRLMAKTKWLVHQFNLAATAHGLAIIKNNGE
jgi:hypothetical protein